MNQSLLRLCAFLPAVLAAAGEPLPAATAEGEEVREIRDLWSNPAIFHPEFFPEAGTLTYEDLFLAGLASRFPNRVHREPPEIEPGASREPHVADLFDGLVYVRVRNLETALPVLEERLAQSALVIDLRNVHAEREAVLELGALLALNERANLALIEFSGSETGELRTMRLPLESSRARRPLQPVFVLTNGRTAGPIEALLAELQAGGQIISVGMATAGKTGSFHRVLDDPALYVLSGELRPASGGSLLESGFVPAVRLDVPDGDDRRAYRALEEGKPLEKLISAAADTGDPHAGPARLEDLVTEETPHPPDEDSEIVDSVLQRAYFIAVALQSMGKIASP